MSLIEIKDLSFAYPSSKDLVLKQITCTFSKEEIVAIIGVNGAGKTTLAKLIIGMLKPNSGQILIEGETTQDKSIAKIAQKVGFVFQNPNTMIFTQKVRQELELSLQRFELSKEEANNRIQRMYDFLDLEKYSESHPRLLSRGEKQKLSLASVLIQEPKAIILDEPFSGIDITQKTLIRNYLLKLKQQEKLVIIITHDLESIMEFADRLIALKDGQIFFDGSPQKFFTTEVNLSSIGLSETDYLSLIYKLRKFGLPSDIVTKSELIQYLSQKTSI